MCSIASLGTSHGEAGQGWEQPFGIARVLATRVRAFSSFQRCLLYSGEGCGDSSVGEVLAKSPGLRPRPV